MARGDNISNDKWKDGGGGERWRLISLLFFLPVFSTRGFFCRSVVGVCTTRILNQFPPSGLSMVVKPFGIYRCDFNRFCRNQAHQRAEVFMVTEAVEGCRPRQVMFWCHPLQGIYVVRQLVRPSFTIEFDLRLNQSHRRYSTKPR